MFEGRGHDVLGQAVQPVRQLVAPPTQQQGLGTHGLVERELAELWAVLDQADPAAVPEAFVTGRVLDDSVERDVVAHDDLSHFGSPFVVCSDTDGGENGTADPFDLKMEGRSVPGRAGVLTVMTATEQADARSSCRATL